MVIRSTKNNKMMIFYKKKKGFSSYPFLYVTDSKQQGNCVLRSLPTNAAERLTPVRQSHQAAFPYKDKQKHKSLTADVKSQGRHMRTKYGI